MKSNLLRVSLKPRQIAFTLPEAMIAIMVFTLATGGLITAYLYGMRISFVEEIRLSASDDARQTVSRLVQDIRSGNMIQVGSGGVSNFTPVADNAQQVGNALQIYVGTTTNMTADTNNWVRYYYNSPDNSLRRMTNGATNFSLVTANLITNKSASGASYNIFSMMDANDVIFTNPQAVPVVMVTLPFTKIKNPYVPIAPGCLFDYYVLQTKITPRVRP
jgi:type II secretory pathway pseudopilin PulG